MTVTCRVILTELGQKYSRHRQGEVNVELRDMYESVGVDPSGSLVFKFLDGDLLVFAPGMWATFTTKSNEE